jgi:hypothetical protein
MSEINGILDKSTQQVLVLGDDRIILRGNVTIHGVLDVGLVKTDELIADARYDKKFLTFVAPEGTQISGTGLLWHHPVQNKQLVYKANPESFFLSEHVDIPQDKAYLIGGSPIITTTELGGSVTKSNLREVGTLHSLTVGGSVNFADCFFFNPASQRLSLGRDDPNGKFSIYDQVYDVEIIIDTNDQGRAKIGTSNNRGLDFVTGDQTRISLGANGNITLGLENNNTTVNLNGKVGVNVKNPEEDLEVNGNLKFQNKLFTIGDRPPTEGSFQRGDIVWNSDPMVSNYVGWICTAGGRPGNWAPFGLIVG